MDSQDSVGCRKLLITAYIRVRKHNRRPMRIRQASAAESSPHNNCEISVLTGYRHGYIDLNPSGQVDFLEPQRTGG